MEDNKNTKNTITKKVNRQRGKRSTATKKTKLDKNISTATTTNNSDIVQNPSSVLLKSLKGSASSSRKSKKNVASSAVQSKFLKSSTATKKSTSSKSKKKGHVKTARNKNKLKTLIETENLIEDDLSDSSTEALQLAVGDGAVASVTGVLPKAKPKHKRKGKSVLLPVTQESHGVALESVGSDDSDASVKSNFDDEYYALQPPPKPIDPSKLTVIAPKNIVCKESARQEPSSKSSASLMANMQPTSSGDFFGDRNQNRDSLGLMPRRFTSRLTEQNHRRLAPITEQPSVSDGEYVVFDRNDYERIPDNSRTTFDKWLNCFKILCFLDDRTW